MAWRVAKSLLVLLGEINAAYPTRSKASDGTIGDPAHQSQGSASDHNPWVHLYGDPTGVVTALDITHDPAHGCDIDRLTDQLAASRDSRIKYVIANGLILSGNGGPSPWVWRGYGGSDPHTNHFHLSVEADPRCDDPRPWGITGVAPAPEGQPMSIMDDPHFAVLAWRMAALTDGTDTATGGPLAGRPMWAVQVLKRIEANAAKAAQASTAAASAVAPTQEQIDAAMLRALQDPTVISALGAAVASHIHVS